MSITWNTGLAAERVRHNRRLKNRELNSFKRRPAAQAASSKRQAASAIKGTHSNGRILKIERKC
jgi:hypothetical protein